MLIDNTGYIHISDPTARKEFPVVNIPEEMIIASATPEGLEPTLRESEYDEMFSADEDQTKIKFMDVGRVDPPHIRKNVDNVVNKASIITTHFLPLWMTE